MDDTLSSVEEIIEKCECGDFKEQDEQYCYNCQKSSKEGSKAKSKPKCKICHYFLDPSLCFSCNKRRTINQNNTRVVTSVRDNVIVPEHLVYRFQQRRLNHPKNQQPEDKSFDVGCEQE